MLLQESGNDIRTEGEGDTTIVLGPASDILVGIRPQQVTEQTTVGNVRGTHDSADLLHGVEIRAQTTVHGEDFLVDDGCNRQAVEAVRKRLPQLNVVTSLALIVEPVNAVDAGALVVSAEDEEVFRVFDLVGQQQADGLERLLASVDVVAEEEVVGLWREASVLEQAQEVVVLSVDIAANLSLVSVTKHWTLVLQIHTFIGASSSSSMGWEMKISRALVQRYRISVSSNCTCFPGRLPRTSRRRSMMESRSTSPESAIVGGGVGVRGKS